MHSSPMQVKMGIFRLFKFLLRSFVCLVKQEKSNLCILSIFNSVYAKSLQSCPSLCNLMDCSPSGYSICGILQTRMLEWVTMTSSRVSSQPSDSLPLVPPGKTEPNQMEQKVNSSLTSSTPYNISSSEPGCPLKYLCLMFCQLYFIFSKMIWILFFPLFIQIYFKQFQWDSPPNQVLGRSWKYRHEETQHLALWWSDRTQYFKIIRHGDCQHFHISQVVPCWKKCTTPELQVLLGANEDCSLGDSISDSSEKLLWEGKRGARIYKSCCNKGQIRTSKDYC